MSLQRQHFLLSYLKTLSVGPAGFELTTSRTVVRHSTNWANRSAVKKKKKAFKHLRKARVKERPSWSDWRLMRIQWNLLRYLMVKGDHGRFIDHRRGCFARTSVDSLMRKLHVIFRCCLFLAARIRVIMVYCSHISNSMHEIIGGILKIKRSGANFLGFWLFNTPSLSIVKTLRTRNGRLLRFSRVKDSRITAWTNIFTATNANLDVSFHKMQWSWIDKSLEFFFPLLTLIGVHRKTKITEIRSLLASIAANSSSTILDHGTHGNKLQRAEKYAEIPDDLSKTHGFPFNVCFHFSRCIPRSLASACDFRHQSFKLKYFEIGLFSRKSKREPHVCRLP